MPKLQKLILLFFSINFSLFGTTFLINPVNSSIKFSVKHLFFLTATGSFTSFDGIAQWNKKNLKTSYVKGTVYVNSIQTVKETYNQMLLKPTYFDEKKFKTMSFESTKISKTPSENIYKIKGILTVKGIPIPINENAIITLSQNEKNKATFHCKTIFFIDRYQCNIAKNITWPFLAQHVLLSINFAGIQN